MRLINELEEFTKEIKQRDIYPPIYTINGASCNPIVNIGGQNYLSFSTNNYLGLATAKKLIDAAKKAINVYGVGPCSARLMAGNLDIYERLESTTADFLGFEDVVIFSSGYMANIGAITSIVSSPWAGVFSFFGNKDRKTIIISDEYNHASIVDACRLSMADKVIFKHNDCDDLRRHLEENTPVNKLVIVEGIYSMDGDIAPLDKIIELVKEHKAMIMIDDAHATGVLGKQGKGSFEYFGIPSSEVDILMGTYVKAFGSVGGFIGAKKEIIDYLKIAARPFIFSISIPPACAEATIQAINIIRNQASLREKLWDNTNYLRNRLKGKGFNTMKSGSPIIPIFIGDEDQAMKISTELYESKLLVPCIRWPAVKKGKARLRISLTASHNKDHIDHLLKQLDNLRAYF